MSGRVCDGRRGKGERPYGGREDCASMGAVEVAGVRARACAWPKWGAKCHHFGEGQPHLGGVLPTGWLLGGLAPRLHLWPVCYVQKHPHARSQGTAGSTTVSHRVAQGNLSQRGVRAPGGERLMQREHRQGRKVLPSLGTALLGCDLSAAQGALPCMQPNHPCCSHVLLTCTAPSSSALWALLQGLQGRLSHCGTSSPEPAINEGPFACHLSGLIRRAAPLFPSPTLADLLASHTHRSKTQRYRGSYQHILTKLMSAFLLRRVNQQANTTYCPNRSQPSSKIWGTVGAA